MPEKKKKGQSKIAKVMKEFRKGTLKSSAGQHVKSKDQAIAIALSEAREADVKIPKKKNLAKVVEKMRY